MNVIDLNQRPGTLEKHFLQHNKKQKYKIVSADIDAYKKKKWTTLFENGKIKKAYKKDIGIPQNQFLQGVCMITDD